MTDDDDLFFRDVSPDEALGPINVGNPLENPLSVAATLAVWLLANDGPDVEQLERLVTPESRPRWGDFSAAAETLRTAGMIQTVEFAGPEVVYVPFTPDSGRPVELRPGAPLLVLAFATLVRDPRWVGWRVHQLGVKASPEEVPRGG